MDILKNDAEVRRVLAGFAPVWQRVSGSEPMPERKEDDTLRRFIRDEAKAAACDARLCGCFRGAGFLCFHANGASRRARRLAAELFLLTGERADRRDACEPVRDALLSLKTAMDRDTAAAREYENAASRTGDARLAALYRSYAAERAAAAEQKRGFILRIF